MQSRRIKQSGAQRRKRKALRRVKPRRGTVPFLLLLIALVVVLIIFAPGLSLTPAANVSGTVLEEADVSTGDRSLRISEVMSSNRSAFPDEVGSFPDWIELTNTGDHPIPLKGYGLSDRADKITFIFRTLPLIPARTSSYSPLTKTRTPPGRPCTPNSSSPPPGTSSSSSAATASPLRRSKSRLWTAI